MIEKAYQIFDYLPVSFKSEKDQEYITFLWDAFESNYQNGKYQFAFLAFHMLYMSFVYFTIWKIKKNRPEDFNKAMVGFRNQDENRLLNATSPFTFSKVNESTIFRFLKLVGCVNSDVGSYAKLVNDRNDIAHSNGNIFYADIKTIDDKITEILKLVDGIQKSSLCVVLECFVKFLLSSYDPNTREYSDTVDQIRELLIADNYLSKTEIEACLHYDINKLSTRPRFTKIKTLYQAIVKVYNPE